MKNKVASVFIGATLLVGGGTVDMVPRETNVMFAYQQEAGVQGTIEYITATGTIISASPQPQYEDTDKDGKISVQVSVDTKGNLVFAQIDEAKYKDYNKAGSYLASEKLTYYITPAEALAESFVEIAQADTISLDSAPGLIPNCSPCTSLTWSHTVTGTNPALIVSAHDGTAASWSITGVTYAGAAMTEVGHQGTTQPIWASLWYKTGTTGTNNIVVSVSASHSLLGGSVSYTGVDQTSPIDVHGGATTASTNITKSLTTTVDNAWLIASISANRTLSPASGSTYRDSCCGYGMYDTNGPKTPAGSYSVGATQSDSTTGAIYALALKPASDAPISTTNNSCRGSFRGTWYCDQ